MRILIHWLVRLLYRFRAYNVAALDTPGPVLLLPNHVSWWDWLLIGVCLERDWRFVTSSATADLSWLHQRVMVNRRTFPVDMNSPLRRQAHRGVPARRRTPGALSRRADFPAPAR